MALFNLKANRIKEVKIRDWKRPLHWAAYPEMEEQIWEVERLKELSLYLNEHQNFNFDISLDDETCIYVTLTEFNKTKAECFVNRGDHGKAVFSIFAGEEENEYHGAEYEEILKLILNSQGYMKQDES